MSAAQKALVNPSAVLRNRKILDRVHTIMAILVGLAAGITGLTGLKGFAAFALSHLVVGVAILAVKMGGALSVFQPASLPSFLLGGLFDNLMSFLLFWTLAYALVHIY